MRRIIALALLAAPLSLRAQDAFRYTLRVDSADLTSIHVELRIPAAPDTLRLAMATHDEYDDRYWRYVRDLKAESNGAALAVTREDSAVWRIAEARGSVTISYRIALPPPEIAFGRRRSWMSYLTPNGGLVGSIDCLMYVPGRMKSPALLLMDIPAGWRIATGLEHTDRATEFRAANAATLLDSPLLIGHLREWSISNANVAFLPTPATVSFDSAAFLNVIQRITTQAIEIFGGAPYRDYTFLLQDNAGDALEHVNSLVLGVNSAELAKDPAAYATEFAHEFFHTWNLIRLHPVGLRALHTGAPSAVSELWWSEGITIFFADEMLQRAGLYPASSGRATRLAARIARYLNNPGYTHISPQRASLSVGQPPGPNGDYSGDYYLSGQILGDLLELIIRDSTNGARGMDAVIDTLYARAAGEPGYTLADIERAANTVCGCELRPFFGAHVRDAKPFDFDAAVRSMGYRTEIVWGTAKDSAGAPITDTRIFAMRPEGAPPSTPLIIGVTRPTGAWAHAGLHSGDLLLEVNGQPVASSTDFRRMLAGFQLGQHVTVTYSRAGHRAKANVMIDAYVVASVTLVDLPTVTPQQLARRAAWASAQ